MTLSDDKFENTEVEIGSETTTLNQIIGSGKEGTVYSLENVQTEVVKIFSPRRRQQKRLKVKEMVRNQPQQITDNKSKPPDLVWPLEVVQTVPDSEFLGYSMPRLNITEFDNALKYARNSLSHSESTSEARYSAALNLALKVALVHVNGHAVGDMHHTNILVNDGHVTLIDCDGFHISGKSRDFGGSTFWPRYEPPDTRRRGDTVHEVQLSDQFGLAVHIFQFLMAGFHPFVATGSEATSGSTEAAIHGNRFPYKDPDPGRLEPPRHAPDYGKLPSDIKALFDAAFISGKEKPANRPAAIDWLNTLADLSYTDVSTPQPSRTDDPSEELDDKWKRQREQRRQQYTSSESMEGTDESKTDANETSSSASATAGTADSSGPRESHKDSYSRDSRNWAEEIRNDYSSQDTSSSTSAPTRSRRSSSSSQSTSSTNVFQYVLIAIMLLIVLIFLFLI